MDIHSPDQTLLISGWSSSFSSRNVPDIDLFVEHRYLIVRETDLLRGFDFNPGILAQLAVTFDWSKLEKLLGKLT